MARGLPQNLLGHPQAVVAQLLRTEGEPSDKIKINLPIGEGLGDRDGAGYGP